MHTSGGGEGGGGEGEGGGGEGGGGEGEGGGGDGDGGGQPPKRHVRHVVSAPLMLNEHAKLGKAPKPQRCVGGANGERVLVADRYGAVEFGAKVAD